MGRTAPLPVEMVKSPHCVGGVGDEKENVKEGDEGVVLQLLFVVGFPTVNWFVDPPEPNPVESDIVSRNCVPVDNDNCDIE
jgi:hypothetical protein